MTKLGQHSSHTISGSPLGIIPKEGVATFGQPQQSQTPNGPPHVRRQKGSVAGVEYEQRLPGSPGTAAQAPSHGQESPAEDAAVEENRATAVFASVAGEGSAGAGATQAGPASEPRELDEDGDAAGS